MSYLNRLRRLSLCVRAAKKDDKKVSFSRGIQVEQGRVSRRNFSSFLLLNILNKGDKTSLYDRMGYWDSSYKEISVDDSLRHGILIPQIPFESIGEG